MFIFDLFHIFVVSYYTYLIVELNYQYQRHVKIGNISENKYEQTYSYQSVHAGFIPSNVRIKWIVRMWACPGRRLDQPTPMRVRRTEAARHALIMCFVKTNPSLHTSYIIFS